jgi:hypothetical protein
MIVPCPHCESKLNLPENVEGKQVRCPSCKEVFRADKEVLEESVQAGPPEPAPTSVKPKPPDDEAERPRRRSRSRYADYEDDDDDFEPPEIGHDIDEMIANAKPQMRPAGYVMLAAFVFTALNIAGNLTLNVLAHQELGAGPGGDVAVVAETISGITIYSIPLIVMMLAGRALLTLGSRGLIIAAIVMNFILLFILGAFAAVNAVILASGQAPIPVYLILPTVMMNSISCVLNLGAAVMAIRVLMLADVKEAYIVQRADLSRRRHY